jgi:hypothetical protein
MALPVAGEIRHGYQRTAIRLCVDANRAPRRIGGSAGYFRTLKRRPVICPDSANVVA